MYESPSAASSIASVVMNGGRLSLTTGNALTQPAAAPTEIVTAQRGGDQREAGEMHRVRERRADDAGQRRKRADREIDAAGNDDERLPDAEDAVVRDLAQHANQVGRLEESAVRRHVDDVTRTPSSTTAPPIRSA